MNQQHTIQSGLYQCNMGGASIGECWRFGKGYGFPIALFFKIIHKKMGYNWLPVHETSRYCDFGHLRERTRKKLRPQVEDTFSLGFQEGRYLVGEKIFTDGYIEGGGYVALHQDQKRVIRIAYAYTKREVEGIGTSVESSELICIIGFYSSTNKYPVYVCNNSKRFDGCGRETSIYLKTKDIKIIAEKTEIELHNYNEPIQSFQDITRLDEFIRPIENELWLHRINRGLFVKVPPEEEIQVLRSMKDNNSTPTGYKPVGSFAAV